MKVGPTEQKDLRSLRPGTGERGGRGGVGWGCRLVHWSESEVPRCSQESDKPGVQSTCVTHARVIVSADSGFRATPP